MTQRILLLPSYYGRNDNRRSRVEAIIIIIITIMQKAIAGVDAGEEQHLAAAHFDSEQFESGQI